MEGTVWGGPALTLLRETNRDPGQLADRFMTQVIIKPYTLELTEVTTQIYSEHKNDHHLDCEKKTENVKNW